jgi:NADPH:quinone reductase
MTGSALPDVQPLQFMNMQAFRGFSLPYLQQQHPDLIARGWADLIRFWRQGQVRPIVQHTFAFEQVAAAHRLLETRQSVGKVVLTLA